MASITVRLRPQESAPEAPRRPDGRRYRFELAHSDGRTRTYGDEPAELLAALLPGYADPDRDAGARTAQRVEHAVRIQTRTQAALNIEYGFGGCAEDKRDILLADRSVPPEVVLWAALVPLVLVDAHYAPCADRRRPAAEAPGVLIWLRPSDEWQYLVSLAEIGAVMLSRAD